ncbi:MAG: DNA-processing protein DprA [Acidimicrobiales bacterium]
MSAAGGARAHGSAKDGSRKRRSGPLPWTDALMGPTPPQDSRAEHDALVAALLGLPGMGPSRLAALLAGAGSAQSAWTIVRAGPGHRGWDGVDLGPGGRPLPSAWAQAASQVEPARLAARHQLAGIALLGWGSPRYPQRLRQDVEPPVLLFARGRLGQLQRPTVAILGTRRATPYGLRLARNWAAELTEAGVVVVSGLAAGIDAAAHEGALEVLEPPAQDQLDPDQVDGDDPYDRARADPLAVAVVGSGLDVPYPTSSRGLWRRLVRMGVLLSEAPMGTPPDAWRFPARNRIIAALADVVLIVESHERGGALLTAEEAAYRHRPVLAIPGSVHASASAGTNRLIMDGALAALSVADVLAALPVGRRGGVGVTEPRTPGWEPVPSAGRPPGDPWPALVVSGRALEPDDAALLEALGWEPADLDDLQERTGWSLGRISAAVERLLVGDRLVRQGTGFVQVHPT